MKRLLLLIIVPTLSLHATAGEFESKVGESFVQTYGGEQIKGRIAEYINQHPEILNSTSKTVGTEALGFLGHIMAAHNLMNAHSDKERFWAGVSVAQSGASLFSGGLSFMPAEPSTALIIFALQIADTMVSMKHNAYMARIQAETKALQAKAEALNEVYTTNRNLARQKLSDGFDETIKQIDGLLEKLEKNELFVYVNSSQKSALAAPSANQIQDAIALLLDLDLAYSALDSYLVYIEHVITPERPDVAKAAQTKVVRHEPVRNQLRVLHPLILKIFARGEAKQKEEEIRLSLLAYGSNLEMYLTCANLQSQVMLGQIRDQNEPYAGDLIEQCQVAYNMNFGQANEVY